MKKSTFGAMIAGTIGGLLFALGMCMTLIPEWNASGQGTVLGIIGAGILLITFLLWRQAEHKAPIRISGKTVGAAGIGLGGAVALGIGMCLTMVWSVMLPGVLIGLAGIIVLLCLIPYIKGFK